MGGRYNTGGAGKNSHMIYDDSAFQLFVVALLAVYWIPTLLLRLHRLIKRLTHVETPLEKAKKDWCSCAKCQEKADEFRAKDKRHIGLSDLFFLVVTILLVFTSVKVYQANLIAEAPFDPFAILGVSEDANAKQVRKAYRRLSVLHHPDKNRDDPSAGERFIKITKAFAALTDETAKANYAKYGNPDGYLGTSLGLGLPEWVAESRNGVLFTYFLLMVLVFPTMVGMWWHKRSQQLTSEIMTSTFMLYRETLQQTTRFRDLLAAFCSSYEFSGLYNSENDELLAGLSDALKRSSKADMKKTKSVVEPQQFQVQNLLVMSAYLARMAIPDKLEYVKKEILLRSEALMTAMTDTVGVFQRPDCQKAWDKSFMHGHTVYLATCISLTQCILQQLDEKSSPFLQIPHFTEREVKFCLASRSPTIRSIYDFMKLDMEEQRKILRDFSGDQLLDVRAFCARFPSATVEVSDAVVEGEEDSTVHAGDTVTVRATLTVMRRSGSGFSPHVPNVPFKKEEVWWVWLADERLMCPIEVRRLLPKMARGHDTAKRRKGGDGCCGEASEEEETCASGGKSEEHMKRLASDPRVSVFDLKFRFQAPRAGEYNLGVTAACDCYKGASKSATIKMKVAKEVEPPPVDSVRYFDTDEESAVSSSEEEEEEEEDSDEEGTEADYEYIEVTDEESEGGDFEEEDEYGIAGEGAKGNPAH